jgi:hypothetical protein
MKVLHITPSSNGYQEVELLANRYNEKNSLAVIKINDKINITGGMLFSDTRFIREVLGMIPREDQYKFKMGIIINF